MESNASMQISFNVTVPSDICGGQYYLNVVVNESKTLKEKDYNDNAAKQLVYLKGNLPDLSVSEISVPSEINTSEPAEISFKVNNINTSLKFNLCR